MVPDAETSLKVDPVQLVDGYPPINPYSWDKRGYVSISGDSIRRFVIPELVQITQELHASGAMNRLNAAGLISTQFGGTDPIPWVTHELLPYVVYPQEFTIEMLRDAALCTLDIALELSKSDMHLQDAHPWNVSFKHGKAVFLDYSSICKGGTLPQWWIQEFFLDFYVPIWLRSLNFRPRNLAELSKLAQCEDPSAFIGSSPRTFIKTLFSKTRVRQFCRSFWKLVSSHQNNLNPAAILVDLRQHIASIKFPKIKSEWDDYVDPGGSYEDVESFSPKAKAVHSFLKELTPGRLVDLACNSGWFTGLAARMGHTCLGVDYDVSALETARQTRASKFQFDVATANVLWPTPPQGIATALKSAPDRWQCDTLLMIALAHHLVIRQRLHFDGLAQLVTLYSPKNLIIEFVPRDDVFVRTWPQVHGTPLPDWYNETDFEKCFLKHFSRFKRLDSGLTATDSKEPTRRYMYFFQR